jgi:hypothetical protein
MLRHCRPPWCTLYFLQSVIETWQKREHWCHWILGPGVIYGSTSLQNMQLLLRHIFKNIKLQYGNREKILFRFPFGGDNYSTTGVRHVAICTEPDHEYIYTSVRNTVCKSKITNTATKRNFELISGKYNVRLLEDGYPQGCFTTLGHNCRRWFPRSLRSKKFI